MNNIIKQIESQKLFFGSGITKSYEFRIKNLTALKKNIIKHENDIADALYKDLKKSEFESYVTEISFVLSEIDYAVKHLRKWMRCEIKSTPLALFPSKSRIVKEPYGVVLIISPWNYPFQLTLSPLVGAMAAGNCAVLKPSPSAPATAEVMEKIIKETFDDKYISIVNSDNEMTNILLKERFDYIFYTGSVTYGKVVMRAASEYLTPVTLELGGKSPCIVDTDANIKIAARRIVWGKFLNSGQTCVAPDYIMVHNSVKQDLIDFIKSEIEKQFGCNVRLSPDYPRIISKQRFEHLSLLMKNGDIISGGVTDENELYISPTLLDNVSLNDDIMQEEIFGPLLPVIGFDDIEKVIKYVNDNEKPLALYYFGQTKCNAEKVIKATSSGGVCINDVVIHVANNKLPFGGVGNSGMGSYHGKYGFETFSHKKAVMTTTTKIDLKMKYAPYKDKIKMIKKMM